MSSAHRKPMTRGEFLAWEERQEFKWEFDGFAPVAMTGGTFGACQNPAQSQPGSDAPPARQAGANRLVPM